MGSRQRRSGADKGKEGADRKMIETIKEATGATEDDIKVMLEECNFDANETTSRLIDNPFSQVQSRKDKKKKRDEDRKKEPSSKIMEIRRNSSSGGRGRGHDRDRGQRGDRGPERSSDRGFRPQANSATSTYPPVHVEKQPHASEEEASGWDAVGSQDLEPQTDRPVASAGGWGEIGSKPPGQASAQQPIGKQTLPAPIRPPGSQKAGGKSMAELLKASLKGDSALGGQHAASSNSKHPGTSTSQLQETQPLYSGQESEANGWGSLHGLEPDSSRQSSSLGGVAIEAPKKLGGSQQPIQAGGSSAGTSSIFPPSQTPVGSLGNAPPSPQRSKLEEQSSSNAWGMPSSASSGVGLGGVPVEAPPRQHSQLDQAQRSAFTADQSAPGVTSWAPKTSASAGGTSLGGSILNSIQPQPSAHSVASEALAASSPRGQNQVNPGSSHSNFGQSPMVIPSPNQANKDLSSATIQFGGFSLGNTSQDPAGFASPAFPSAYERNASSQTELPATLGPSASEPFKPSYSHIPPTSLAQAQQQKAYNAFTSAGQPQSQTLGTGQRASNVYNPEPSSSSASSHPLYGQGYGQNYGSGSQSFNQYQPSSQQQAYQNYNSYQAPTETDSKGSQGSTSQVTSQPPATSAGKTGLSYDASQASYPQYTSHNHTAPAKDYQAPPATKYGSSGHVPVATGPVSGHNLAQVVNQTPLTVPSGYGGGQGSSLQGYGGYGGQQGYGNNSYQQYNNYAGSGYGGYNQRSSNPYQQQPSAYGQGMKGYAGGNYGGGGGYQHGGVYGAGSHKADKDHLVSHMGGHHNLYSQQQLPLSSQSHFPGGLPSNNQGYGNYSNTNQGYGNYGMGNSRQYSNQY